MRKDAPEPTTSSELLATFEAEAAAVGWQCSHQPGEDLYDVVGLTCSIPNGRDKRSVDMSLETLAEQSGHLREITFLGDYQAILFKDTLEIEAQIAADGPVGMRPITARLLTGTPGLVSEPEEAEDAGGAVDPAFPSAHGGNWHLTVESGDMRIEISPMSNLLSALLGNRDRYTRFPASIKISGFKATQHDEALSLLESYAYSYFFDLDLRFGLPFNLVTKRGRRLLRRRERSGEAPNFPVNKYAQDPLSLYRYGRTATSLPLLQFLAFYQTLEYFFPIYARDSALRRLRSALIDPRFDPRSEGHLHQIMTLATGHGRGPLGPEREQLRATIRACTERDTLAAFIEDPSRKAHFTDSKQQLKGARAITLREASGSLQDQIADRIYGLRCRIVHAKEDGGNLDTEALLPSSKEANRLQPDIDLIQLIAQRALVDRAEAL